MSYYDGERERRYVIDEPPPDSSDLAWRVVRVTLVFYLLAIAALILWMMLQGASINQALVSFIVLYLLCILNYWCVLLLTRFSLDGDEQQRWCIWGAWWCVTVPTVWYLVELPLGQTGGWSLLGFLLTLGFVWFPTIATLIGAVVGYCLFRLYRHIQRGGGATVH